MMSDTRSLSSTTGQLSSTLAPSQNQILQGEDFMDLPIFPFHYAAWEQEQQ